MSRNKGHGCGEGGASLGQLDAILGMRIRRAHGAVQRHFAEHFAELELTQKQVSVLWLTHDHPGLAQTDIAVALDMDRATTMTLVHALEKRGLLLRGAAPRDRRRVAYRLSEAGVAQLRSARAAIAAHEAWLKARFTEAEIEALEEMLARIYR